MRQAQNLHNSDTSANNSLAMGPHVVDLLMIDVDDDDDNDDDNDSNDMNAFSCRCLASKIYWERSQ